jgi:dihydropteroate synthase
MSSNQLQINSKKQLIDVSNPIVMGIVNATPDSFFKGNRFTTDKGLLNCVEKIINEGGKIIDIGGYSTRPTAKVIGQDEEIRRVSEALTIILKKFPNILVSVDTFRSSVVRQTAKNFPIAIINDIGGGTLDNLMFETIADLQIAYILTHTRGTPQTMQLNVKYDNVVSEVMQFLEKRLAQLRLRGVNDVIIDPGFGFAKTTDQNFQLLSKISYFKTLNVPILAGVSRKSMLYNTLKISPEESLNATTAANMLALVGGTNILRVHDVKEAMQAIVLFEKYSKAAIGEL